MADRVTTRQEGRDLRFFHNDRDCGIAYKWWRVSNDETMVIARPAIGKPGPAGLRLTRENADLDAVHRALEGALGGVPLYAPQGL